jgi:DNA-binding LacI/PurR family transcriptional regulator
VVYLSSATLPNRVTLDTGRWAESALGLLAEQGCRRVGAICSLRRQEAVVDAGLHDYNRFFDALGKSAGRLGMELREEWVFQPEGSFANTAVEIPEFGFRSMQRLWNLKERPEGLVVFDDVTATGVLMAVMREQISVPGELKLVLHRNAEVGLFCPVPASFLDIRIKGVADALLMQARRLYDGDEVSTIQISPHPVRALAVQTV